MTQENILLLGIGNLLWADEGFGVRAVQALHRQWRFPARVTLMDGGTQGFNLLPHVQSAHRLIVFDAIDYGLSPGSLRMLTGEQVPRFMGAKKMSLHQTGFQEVLAVAELTGKLPGELVLIGVQPVAIDNYGGGLSALVGERIPAALALALDCLQRWGCKYEPRDAAPGDAELLLPASLAMDVFEAGRSCSACPPSAVCRCA